MHEIFILKIDKFLRRQINPPNNLIKIEQKVIHDNTFFLMTDFLITIRLITLYHGLLFLSYNDFRV